MDRLENLATHIEAIQRAVRRVDEIDRTEPVVRGTDELGLRIGAAFTERLGYKAVALFLAVALWLFTHMNGR